MSGNSKVSIEPVITVKHEKKVINKTETPVSAKPKKIAYASASSGVPLEIRNQQILFASIAFIVLIFATTFGLFFWRTTLKFEEETPVVAEEESKVSEVDISSTPVPVLEALNRDEITLEISNASGKSGLAKTVSDQFSELGYTVESTTTEEDTQKESSLIVSSKYTEDQVKLLARDLSRRLGIKEITDFEKIETTAKIVLGEDQLDSAE